MIIRISCLIAFTLATIGCSTTTQRDPIEIEIANAFSRISNSMEQLALIESAAASQSAVATTYDFDTMNLPASWMEEVTLVDDYYGPIESFVQVVSLISSLNEPEVYKEGFRPRFVAIAKGKRKVISFLADAGYQAGDKVEVTPIIQADKVVVRYR